MRVLKAASVTGAPLAQRPVRERRTMSQENVEQAIQRAGGRWRCCATPRSGRTPSRSRRSSPTGAANSAPGGTRSRCWTSRTT
ncbi:hypothetical protein NKH77_55510 [Streptomyces sp. M19]